MKKLMWFVVLMSVQSLAWAAPVIDINLALGGLNPEDGKAKETWGPDFFLQGGLGVRDQESGWGVRGNLGKYSTISRHPADIGTNTTFDLTQLSASLLYHVGSANAFLKPYVGTGAGVYFYSIQDKTGGLESGSKFGFHVLGGVKMAVNENFYIQLELSHQFMPPIFFTGSKNFDNTILSAGIGFTFGIPEKRKPKPSVIENRITSDIQDLTLEIAEMKKRRAQMDQEIDAFYTSDSYDENSPEFAKAYRKIKYFEGKIKTLDQDIIDAKKELETLENRWQVQTAEPMPDPTPVIYQSTTIAPIGGYSVPLAPVRYRYFQNRDSFYYPPRGGGSQISVPTPPPAPTEQERQEYLQKRQTYIMNKKNR